MLTAIRESDHTITTSEGRIIHKKLASIPLKFKSPRRPDEPRRPTNRCQRCGMFSQGSYCETHERVFGIRDKPQEAHHSHTLLPMPHEEPVQDEEIPDSTDEEEQESQTVPHAEETTQDGEEPHESEGTTAATGQTAVEETPLPTTSIGCSTSSTARQMPTTQDRDSTPIRSTNTTNGEAEREKDNGNGKTTSQIEKDKKSELQVGSKPSQV